MNGLFAVLGRAERLASPAGVPSCDPELSVELEGLEGLPWTRTLSGQLSVRPQGMSRWPRLDRYGRALARACDAAVRRELAGAGAPSGLYVSSLWSCHETNAAFDRGLIEKGPRLASPMLFPYTLPGAAAAEVAMLFGLGGAHLVFPGGARAALGSLVAAVDALEDGEAERVLVASADVLGGATLRAMLEHKEIESEEPPLTEAAAAIWVGRPDDPAPGQRRAVEAAIGPPCLDASACERLMREALERAGVAGDSLAEVISTSSTRRGHEVESAAVERLMPGLPLLRLPWRTGNAGAPLGLLALFAALDEEPPRLILACDRGGALAAVIT